MVAFSEKRDGPALTSTKKFSYEIEDVLKQVYGVTVPYCYLLPHYFLGDFLMAFDQNLKPVPVPEAIVEVKWGQVKPAPNDGKIYLALLVGGWNTLIRNDGRPLGTMVAKIRQLKTIGYHPVLVS